MKNFNWLRPALFTCALAMARTSAVASSAIYLENNSTANSAVTYDDNGTGNFPIVTTILSAPSGSVYNPGSSLDGYTYGNWSYLAADTTGSIDLFYSGTAAGPVANYPVPTVGDTISASGNWSPFDGIPEIANSTANPINVMGPLTSGNAPYAPGAPVLASISMINVGTNSQGINASGLAGRYLQLDNVTISGLGPNWLVHENNSGTITDQGGNSMTMFLWASSYSSCGAIAASGGPVPTGLVDMTGFVDDFDNSAEFVPTSITAVPEPSALSLCGISLLTMFYLRLRKI